MPTYKIYVFESLEGIVEAASATQAEEKADDYMTYTCIDDIEARLLSFPKDVDHESYVDCLIARERIWYLPKGWTLEQETIDRAARREASREQRRVYKVAYEEARKLRNAK